MKKRYIILLAFLIFTAIWIAFIWGNSFTVGSASGEMSGSVTAWVNGVLQKIFPSFEVTNLFIRKLAHFAEFAVLGALLGIDFLILFPNKKTFYILLGAPCTILVAMIDEFIQLFVDGRVGSFTDVLIDSSGALTAVLMVFGIAYIKNLHKKAAIE